MNQEEQEKESFHDILHKKMNDYAHSIYRLSKKFPREEVLRRSSISVASNFIEGYARRRSKVYKNF